MAPEELLTPVHTISTARITASQQQQSSVISAVRISNGHSVSSVASSEEALSLLRADPNILGVRKILRYLISDPKNDQLNISPNPITAQILNVLAGSTVPTHWKTLRQSKFTEDLHNKEGKLYADTYQLLLKCFSSVSGLRAIEVRLRRLLDSANEKQNYVGGPAYSEHVTDLLELLMDVLHSDHFVKTKWLEIQELHREDIRALIWKDLISLLCMGKLLAISGEAVNLIKTSTKDIEQKIWIGNGAEFSRWLGRNVVTLAWHARANDKAACAAAELFGKSFSLGYTDSVVEEVYSGLLADTQSNMAVMRNLLCNLPRSQQRQFLYSLLRLFANHPLIARDGFPDDKPRPIPSLKAEAGAAGLLTIIINGNALLKESLMTWLLGHSGGGPGDSFAVRRSATAALSSDQESTRDLLDKCMRQFGDKLYIKHTPILLQEANVQVLLLTAGALHRLDKSVVIKLGRSPVYLNAISNRLGASSSKSRLLGMIVGTAISNFVDSPDKRMKFSMEDMDTPEVQRYLTLVADPLGVGPVEGLKVERALTLYEETRRRVIRNSASASVRSTTSTHVTKIEAIEEINSEDEKIDDDDLPAYDKPDSDMEDEEEDPTLIQRDKPTAPVYIRDLLAGLRDSDNYNRHRLALSSAATLIRRKIGFGTEVTDHAEDLAALLTGLHDKFDMEEFQEMRLQAMRAILVAQPTRMGPWYAKAFFDGDYSMAQRASILTTLGMGARELGGYKDDNLSMERGDSTSAALFPSKTLPPKLHETYISQASPLQAIAARLEKTVIGPIATKAADELSGPNALKVRTFSSRMEVEKRRKPIRNELAKIVADAFFYPLTSRWWVQLKAFGNKSVQFSPLLLQSFIKTLALILHASGPSTLSLPQMTSELWDLLLAVRPHSSDDVTVQEALLFAFVTMLEVNEDKHRLAREHPQELLETQTWAEAVFESTAGGDEEGNRVKMLAASVLIKTREIVQKYQRLLMGELGS